MLPESIPPLHRWQPAQAARTADAGALAQCLRASRARTLALLEAYAAALGPLLAVPCSPQLNPPLWELGHIAWFQEFWLARNPQRSLGAQADPLAVRAPALLPQADALYNSSVVAHASRWHLPLPELQATRAYLQATLEQTLGLLAGEASDDAALYFYRLALF
ncbi:MAG: DinB family protein, partial [Rhodoferax sp.]|uniref:DinB family protein n=1 Tax=Rhodoferax sp. TaxID=50421 RepID=UPI003BB789D2